MSKQLTTEVQEDEHEEWEHEYSIMLACDFLQKNIVPLLEEFEFNNSDENYVDGSATHALFVTLIQSLADMGFTEEDLMDDIKSYMNSSLGATLH
jgi:hypothetical protein